MAFESFVEDGQEGIQFGALSQFLTDPLPPFVSVLHTDIVGRTRAQKVIPFFRHFLTVLFDPNKITQQ
jgi:hypothetical protein